MEALRIRDKARNGGCDGGDRCHGALLVVVITSIASNRNRKSVREIGGENGEIGDTIFEFVASKNDK